MLTNAKEMQTITQQNQNNMHDTVIVVDREVMSLAFNVAKVLFPTISKLNKYAGNAANHKWK